IALLQTLTQIWRDDARARALENLKTLNLAWTRVDLLLNAASSDPTGGISEAALAAWVDLGARMLVSGSGSSLKYTEEPPLLRAFDIGDQRYPVFARRFTLLARSALLRSAAYRAELVARWHQLLQKNNPTPKEIAEAALAQIDTLRLLLPAGSVAKALFELD